jgi:uncharacterized membrane protein (UPF0127 family)
MRKHNPNIFLFAALAVALVYLSAYVWVHYYVPNAAAENQTYLYRVNGRDFSIHLVATDAASWEKGLMNTNITNSTMMVFVFPVPGIYSFWMENTTSNLDMMWLNVSGGSGTVVYLVRNATSCVGKSLAWCQDNTYTPTAEANYVIEAKAGFAQANNVTVGTKVELNRIS